MPTSNRILSALDVETDLVLAMFGYLATVITAIDLCAPPGPGALITLSAGDIT